MEGVCRKTLQDVNRDSEQNLRPRISVKNYMSYEIDWAGINMLLAILQCSNSKCLYEGRNYN